MTDVWDEIRRAYERHPTVVAKRTHVRLYMCRYMRDYRAEHRHQPEPEVRRAVEIDADLKKRLMAGR